MDLVYSLSLVSLAGVAPAGVRSIMDCARERTRHTNMKAASDTAVSIIGFSEPFEPATPAATPVPTTANCRDYRTRIAQVSRSLVRQSTFKERRHTAASRRLPQKVKSEIACHVEPTLLSSAHSDNDALDCVDDSGDDE